MHLLDGTIGGVLLKELFQRDGVGTMVARYAVCHILQKYLVVMITVSRCVNFQLITLDHFLNKPIR